MEFFEFFKAVMIGFAIGVFNNIALGVRTRFSVGWLIVVPLVIGVTGAALSDLSPQLSTESYSAASAFTYFYIMGMWVFIGTVITDKVRAYGNKRTKEKENQQA